MNTLRKLVRSVRWLLLKLEQSEARHRRYMNRLLKTNPEMYFRLQEWEHRYTTS